ncbi:MAG: ABC transporter permease [Mycobacteriales bacterium]
MRLYLSLALTGIPLGAMYALQALGIVIVYKTSKVFNFASGAIGLACAYAASTLHARGVPILVVLGVAIALGVAIGVLMELTVRPVGSALAGTVVTLGWLLVLTGGVGAVYGTQVATNAPAQLVPDRPAVDLGGVLVYSEQQLVLLALAAALAGGLAVFFRRTALGTATRAVAEAPDAARLLGIGVDRVNLVAWGLGGAVSGLAGVLVAPLLGGLNTTGLVVLTVQALAAALVGRLSSLPLTFVGGVLLGMLQPVVARALQSFSGVKGTSELTAFVVVLVALLFMRRGGRRDVVQGGLVPVSVRPLPTGRAALAGLLGVVAAALVVPALVGDGGNLSRYNVTQVAVWGLAVLSLVLLVGVVGQVSVCQAVFMGCGAYGTGIAVAHGVPFLLAIALGGLLAAGVATLVGLPAIRLEPLELAIATLSLSFTADRFLYSWPPLASDDGKRDVPRPGFASVDPGHVAAGNRAYAWLALGLFLLACFAVANLRRGRTGAALTALRSSEPATSAMGFSVVSVKLRGFAASGFLAGLAGALYAGLVQGASGASFDFTRSITLLAYAVIIGVASVPGAFFGGLVVTLTTLDFNATTDVASGRTTSVTTLLTGLLLIAVLATSPDGLAGLVRRVQRPRLARTREALA